MGGELSKLPPAEKAALEEAARKQVDDDIEKYAELYKQQHREHKRKKPSTDGALSKKHPSTDLEPPSDSNAMPMRSADSSQTPAANDLLASFKPRKEKETKTTSSSEPHSKSASQANASPNSIQVASKTPKVTSKGSSPPNYSTTAATTSKRSAPDDNTKEPKPISLSALSSIGKIQKRTSVASPQSPDRIEDVSTTISDQRPPRWYRDLQVSTTRNKNDAAVDPLLASLRDLATNAKDLKAPQDQEELHMLFEKVRPKLHIIAFQQVSPQVLKRNRMLHNTSGLPQIFDDRYNSGVPWPFDIKADANELYNKWCKKIFETDMMRGIKFSLKGTKKEGGDSINPNYQDVVPAKVHGQNGLVNGQWWPFQICALRDGAHGLTQGGISGSKDKGAFSCILSGGTDSKGQTYPDVDEGDVVFYCKVSSSISPAERIT